MSLPPIAPTGAMASGEYTDYMISYLNDAIDYAYDELEAYLGKSTLDGWNSQWQRTVTDLDAMVVDLSKRINKLTAQARMAQDALNKL